MNNEMDIIIRDEVAKGLALENARLRDEVERLRKVVLSGAAEEAMEMVRAVQHAIEEERAAILSRCNKLCEECKDDNGNFPDSHAEGSHDAANEIAAFILSRSDVPSHGDDQMSERELAEVKLKLSDGQLMILRGDEAKKWSSQ